MTDTTTPLTEADKILAECAGEPEAEERLATLCDRLERELAAATLSLSEGKGKLWLWRNFVDGRPEYWAFDNPHPIHLDNGDPQTLGEPCGYAVVKPSRNGRPDVPESKVLAAIDRALKKEQAPYAEKTSAALVSVVRAYDHHQDNIAAGLGVVSGGKLRDAIDAARPLLLRAEYEIGTLNADPLPPEAHVTRWKGIDLDPPATSYAEAERRYMEAAGDGAHGLEKPQMGHAVGKRERIDATEEYCDWLAEYQSINAADAEIMAGRYDHFDMAECFAAGVSVGQRWHSQWQLPKEPPPGLLMSMALRYDHGLGCPGYYDQPMMQAANGGASHAQVLEGTLRQMRQLYEEVSGHGFYRPEKESDYAAMRESAQGQRND